jgi:surface antigen
MHAAAAKLYEGRPVGAVETWATPDGTMSGQVKLLHSFDSFNMPCRTIDYTIRFQGMLNSPIPDHYVLNWCRVPAGVWKIVQIPSPS